MLFYILLLGMMIPPVMLIIPQFLVAKSLDLLDKFSGLILVYISMNLAMQTFLLRGFFESIPIELEEAAFIDGASHWTVYSRIILPLSRPALATLSVFAFMESWNAFLWPLFVVRDLELMTLPVGLAALHGRWLTQWNLVMAGTVITVLPMLAIHLLAQKYFVRGVVLSGIKG